MTLENDMAPKSGRGSRDYGIREFQSELPSAQLELVEDSCRSNPLVAEFVSAGRLGLVSGADGMFRLLASSVRGPDVAFVSRDRLPVSQFPQEAYPSLAPDLAIEVLSPSNTKAELVRKRIEYFHSGVRLVWIVDCRSRSLAVYTSPVDVTVLDEEATVTGGDVLSGFECVVGESFSDLDRLSL